MHVCSVCVCVRACVKKKEKKKERKEIVAGPKQPLGAVWCKTRLLNSGGQFDQLCNLIDGAILAQALCQRVVELSSPMVTGVPRSKVCVCVCVRACVRAWARACVGVCVQYLSPGRS